VRPEERDRVQVANDLADGLISEDTEEKIYAYKPPQARSDRERASRANGVCG